MKKLSKLKLSQNAVQMNYHEMKMITGGYSEYVATCSKKTCSVQSDCAPGGYCANISSPGIAGCIGKFCM